MMPRWVAAPPEGRDGVGPEGSTNRGDLDSRGLEPQRSQGREATELEMLEQFGPEVALLSEARFEPGAGLVGHGKTIGRDCKHESEEECDSRPFSTAIVSRHEPQEITTATAKRRGRRLEIPFRPSRAGTWVAATVSIPDVGDVSVVSLYGLTDEKTDASVHRSLSDLEPIFEDRHFNEKLLLGGDLNIFANPRPNDPTRQRHLIVLERIKAYGLFDLIERDAEQRESPRERDGVCPCGIVNCSHVWTFRSRDKRYANVRYQDDHVFASRALADRLKSCESAGFNDASDHAPIVATFWK
jgi:exonuclease III